MKKYFDDYAYIDILKSKKITNPRAYLRLIDDFKGFIEFNRNKDKKFKFRLSKRHQP
jgi:hypothetical protein